MGPLTPVPMPLPPRPRGASTPAPAIMASKAAVMGSWGSGTDGFADGPATTGFGAAGDEAAVAAVVGDTATDTIPGQGLEKVGGGRNDRTGAPDGADAGMAGTVGGGASPAATGAGESGTLGGEYAGAAGPGEEAGPGRGGASRWTTASHGAVATGAAGAAGAVVAGGGVEESEKIVAAGGGGGWETLGGAEATTAKGGPEIEALGEAAWVESARRLAAAKMGGRSGSGGESGGSVDALDGGPGTAPAATAVVALAAVAPLGVAAWCEWCRAAAAAAAVDAAELVAPPVGDIGRPTPAGAAAARCVCWWVLPWCADVGVPIAVAGKPPAPESIPPPEDGNTGSNPSEAAWLSSADDVDAPGEAAAAPMSCAEGPTLSESANA